MFKKLLRLSVLAAVVAAFGVLTGVGAQTVSGSIKGGSVTRGKAARATVVLSIPAGLHVNSNRPTGEYMVPTTVKATAKGVKIGPVSYPRGKNRKFSFSDHPINVYEGQVAFGFNVTAPAGYRGNSVSVRVVVHYQACTNEVCYAPTSKEFTMTASVR